MRLGRVLALFAVLAALGLAVAACGDEGGGGEGATASGSFEGRLEQADFEGMKSGELEIALEIEDYVAAEEINMRVLGIFLGAGEDRMPQFDMAVEAHGPLNEEQIDFDGGLALLEDRAVLNYQGEIFEPDPATFAEVKSSFEESRGEGGAGDVTACLQILEEVSVNDLIDDLSNEGKAESLDGVPVTRLSGDLDVRRAFRTALELTEDPACGVQLALAGSWTAAELKEIERSLGSRLKERRVEVDLDKEDRLRRLGVDLMLIGPEGAKKKKIEVDLDVRVARVNEIQELPNPSPGKSMEALSKKLGLNPLEAIETGRAEGLEGLLEGTSGSSSP